MTLGRTLDGFFTAEYERFNKGLAALGRSDRERFLQQTRRDLEDARRPRVVVTPGWEDVLHVRPRLTPTREQRDEYWQAIKTKRPANLAPEIVTAIETARTKQDFMRRSAQPEFQRAWGSVMTAVDNVQDFLAAISVFGRIALTIGAKIGLRAIPGLGLIVTAADVLSLSVLVGQLAFPGFIALCAGPRAGLAALAGTALTAAAFKGTTALLARASSKSMRWTLRGPSRVQLLTGAIGAALVIGQTTDQLFGYGISLGPIVGGTMGAVYGAEARARGLDVEVRSSPSAEHFAPRVAARLAGLSTQAIVDRLTAADTLASAALILDAGSPADAEDRAATIAALVPAIGVLAQDWSGVGWQDDVPRLVGWEAPPPPPRRDVVTWPDFADPGATLPPQEWPTSWGGKGYIAPQAAQVAAPAIADGVQATLDVVAGLPGAAFYTAAVVDATEALWRLYTDDDEALRREFTPGWLAAERMTALGLLVHPATAPERLQPAWDEAVGRVEGSRHGMMTAGEWLALFERHGVDVIRATPPA